MQYKDGVFATITGFLFEKSKKLGKRKDAMVDTQIKISTSVESGVMIFELPDKKVKFAVRTQDILGVLKQGNEIFQKMRTTTPLVKE